jgi:hypothetical protein
VLVLFPHIERVFESRGSLSDRFQETGMSQLFDKAKHVASGLLRIEIELIRETGLDGLDRCPSVEQFPNQRAGGFIW